MASKKEKQSSRSVRKCAEINRILLRDEVKAQYRKVSEILKKPEGDRNEEERSLLSQSDDVVKSVQKRTKVRELSKQRKLEIEDPESELSVKCRELAQVIQEAKFLVVYTGAGISTAASIPDYRGPNGVWTLLQQGIEPVAQDLSDSDPTYTHMCLTTLHKHGLVKYIVSQNCDGLHIRSGFGRTSLSELHGNMYIEVCRNCTPSREYLRLFDVTERTGIRKHKTGRFCTHCQAELRDTIVHFGEKGDLGPPHNWEEAAQAADSADVILCLGSSLKVLKKYPCLWHNHKAPSKRAKLYIVNLQWTPKDDSAVLKINGRCDDVMKLVMKNLSLQVPEFDVLSDPSFYLSTPLKDTAEASSVSKKTLTQPQGYSFASMERLLGPRCDAFPSYVTNEDSTKSKEWKSRKLKSLSPLKHPVAIKRRSIKEIRKKSMESSDTSDHSTKSDDSLDKKVVKLDHDRNVRGVRNGRSRLGLSHTTLPYKKSWKDRAESRHLTRARISNTPKSMELHSTSLTKQSDSSVSPVLKESSESLSTPSSNDYNCSNNNEEEDKVNLLEECDIKTESVEYSEITNEGASKSSYTKDNLGTFTHEGIKMDCRTVVNSSKDNVNVDTKFGCDTNKPVCSIIDHEEKLDDSLPDNSCHVSDSTEQAKCSQAKTDSTLFSDPEHKLTEKNGSVDKQSGIKSNNSRSSSPKDMPHIFNDPSGADDSNSNSEMTNMSVQLTAADNGTNSVVVSKISEINKTIPTFSESSTSNHAVLSIDSIQNSGSHHIRTSDNLSSIHTTPVTNNSERMNMQDEQIVSQTVNNPPMRNVFTSSPLSSFATKPDNYTSNENLRLLSMASMHVSAVQKQNPDSASFHVSVSSESPLKGSQTEFQRVYSPGNAQQAAPSTNLGPVTFPSPPHVAKSIPVGTIAHVISDVKSPLVTTSPQKPSTGKMITMTVSEYLSTISTKSAGSTTTSVTSTCPVHGTAKAHGEHLSHHHDNKGYNETPHSSSLIRKQLMAPAMPSPAYASQVIPRSTPLHPLTNPETNVLPRGIPPYPPPVYQARLPLSPSVSPQKPVLTSPHKYPGVRTNTHSAHSTGLQSPVGPNLQSPNDTPSHSTAGPIYHSPGGGISHSPGGPILHSPGGAIFHSPGAVFSPSAASQHMQLPIQMPMESQIVHENTPKPKSKKSKKKNKVPVMTVTSSQSHEMHNPAITTGNNLRQPLLSPQTSIPVSSTMTNASKSAPITSLPPGVPNPNDPLYYKFLSECLMRNIQLITGLPVMPLPQPTLPGFAGIPSSVNSFPATASTPVTSLGPSVQSNSSFPAHPKISSYSVVENHVAQPVFSVPKPSTTEVTASFVSPGAPYYGHAAQTDPVHGRDQTPSSHKKKKKKTSHSRQPTNAASHITGHLRENQPHIDHYSAADIIASSQLSPGTAQMPRLPPPAHQVVPQLPQLGPVPSPAHQGTLAPLHVQMPYGYQTTPYMLSPPAAHQVAALQHASAHFAALQQAGLKLPTSTEEPGSLNEPSAMNLSGYMSAISAQNKNASQFLSSDLEHVVSSSGHTNNHLVSTSTTNASSLTCPTIVAALGKPPTQPMRLPTMIPNSEASMPMLSPSGISLAPKLEESVHLSAQQQPLHHSMTENQIQAQREAIKKSIHIQHILQHLQKANPGAPLPPYMFDSKNSVSQEHHPSASVAFQQGHFAKSSTAGAIASCIPAHTAASHRTHSPGIQPGFTVTSSQASAQEISSLSHAEQLGLLSLSVGAQNWPLTSQAVMSVSGTALCQSAPAALLVSSISERSFTNNHNANQTLQSVTPDSLSNSGSYTGVQPQTPQDSTSVHPQYTSQNSEASDTDICYETYLIDTSAAGDEATALQQAQAAVLQQLAYSTDPSDGTQTVVVMNTQDVAFLDDIECEIEIQDAESLSEIPLTEGISLEPGSDLRNESTATTPSAEVMQNTGPSVFTEVVQHQTPEDGQIGQLGMHLMETGEADIGTSSLGGHIWDTAALPSHLHSAIPGHSNLIHQGPIDNTLCKPSQSSILSAPGWFGKGLGIKKTKRKRSK